MPDAVAREDKPETAMTSRNSNSFVFETLETRKLMSASGSSAVDQPADPTVTIVPLHAPKTLEPSIAREDTPTN